MNDINIFVSGEIYLKKGPEPFNASQMLSTIYDKIDDCNFELSKEDSDLSYAWELDACEKLKINLKPLMVKWIILIVIIFGKHL